MSVYYDPELSAIYDEILERRRRIIDILRSKSIKIDKEYSFKQGASSVTLADLFGSSNDLVIIHNMGKSCSHCTLWADGLNGILPHIESRTSVVLMNADSVDAQRAFADGRGWQFRMIHDPGGAFTFDMGFAQDHDGKRHMQPGFSTFHRSHDGAISRVASDEFCPGDMYMGIYHMFDLLHEPGEEWQPKYSYA